MSFEKDLLRVGLGSVVAKVQHRGDLPEGHDVMAMVTDRLMVRVSRLANGTQRTAKDTPLPKGMVRADLYDLLKDYIPVSTREGTHMVLCGDPNRMVDEVLEKIETVSFQIRMETALGNIT